LFLREFDLDLPYIPDQQNITLIMDEQNCEYDTAVKMDYEQNWKEKRRLFRLSTRCISAMFERLFGKSITEDTWKVLVNCVEKISAPNSTNLSGVECIEIEMEYKKFLTVSEPKKSG
jgi:hypothetical protein